MSVRASRSSMKASGIRAMRDQDATGSARRRSGFSRERFVFPREGNNQRLAPLP
jgi:hypothetical protein